MRLARASVIGFSLMKLLPKRTAKYKSLKWSVFTSSSHGHLVHKLRICWHAAAISNAQNRSDQSINSLNLCNRRCLRVNYCIVIRTLPAPYDSRNYGLWERVTVRRKNGIVTETSFDYFRHSTNSVRVPVLYPCTVRRAVEKNQGLQDQTNPDSLTRVLKLPLISTASSFKMSISKR